MIVNEYAFEVLNREQEARLAIELERRRVQLERLAEQGGDARPRGGWLLFRQSARTGRAASRHAH
ncbi:hypothetical protein [Naasia aerilata]|uniref:Uncharacterized protein n=1 Tax=Naasia aerilata TaxID=1162966 RepID=A0ABN6XKS9_9MICO|nr:hypothetical protein [Naasia aerilata]BDZ45522.1 hypothetical protein GCM10025866_14310 [Naasia aerilata]